MNKEEFRKKVLDFALADIGKGEEGENNWGSFVSGILAKVGIDFPDSWCAAAAWHWIDLAYDSMPMISTPELDTWQNKLFRLKTPSAKTMYNKAKELGWVVKNPLPGDLVFFSRPGASWYAHVGVVKREDHISYKVKDEIELQTIEGNKGPFPAKIQIYNYKHPYKNLIGFVRLGGE
jgi:hypothetical protein